MTSSPIGFVIGAPFWARLALVLPEPADQRAWEQHGHGDEIGAEVVGSWSELFPVPDRDPDRWRRVVVPARAPFHEPGWVMYDARLGEDDIAELRRVEYVDADVAEPPLL